MKLPKLKVGPDCLVILPTFTYSPKLFADGSTITVVYDSKGNQLNYTKSNPGGNIKLHKKED